MEVQASKPRGLIRNKYVEYRRMYKRAKDFQAELASKSEDSGSKPSKSEDSKAGGQDPKGTAETKAPEGSKLPSPLGLPKIDTTQTATAEPATLTPTMSVQEQIAAHGSTYIPEPGESRSNSRMINKLAQYRPHIQAAAARYNLPEELITGVIWQESRGNPRAVSHCGAMGLMQLMPGTAKNLGVSNAFDVGQNIDGGAKYLRQMLDKFGRVDFAVAAYNAGPGNVSKFGGVPPFRETRDYVPKVLGNANNFQVAGGWPMQKAPTAVRV